MRELYTLYSSGGRAMKFLLAILFCAACIGAPGATFGQEQFYRGKVLRILVGFAPGGGYDAYTRLLSRHLGKHIPGNPSVVVENMAGANRDRKSTRLNSGHIQKSRMPSSA